MNTNAPIITAYILGQEEEDQDMPVRIKGNTSTSVHPIDRKYAHYPLAALFATMQTDLNFPEYQRAYIWPRDLAAYYILLILHGVEMDKIRTILRHREDGSIYKDVIDGRQQLESIFAFFRNEFTLPTQQVVNKFSPNTFIPALAEGCYYSPDQQKEPRKKAMPADLRSRFNNFELEIATMDRVPPQWERPIFKAYQLGKPLTMGQVLWADTGQAATIAKELLEHPFWYEVFITHDAKKDQHKDKKRLKYLCALQMVAIESVGEPYMLDLGKREMERWSSGLYDDLLPDEVKKRCWHHMNGLCQVLSGAKISGRTDAILFYQLARILEDSHEYDLAHSQKSCLLPWYHQLKRVGVVPGSPYNIGARMMARKGQQRVWKDQMPLLLGKNWGLVKKTQVTEQFLAELATSGRM